MNSEAAEFELKTAVRGRCELPENVIMQAGFWQIGFVILWYRADLGALMRPRGAADEAFLNQAHRAVVAEVE